MVKPLSSRSDAPERAAPASVLGPRQNKLLLMQYVTHTCSVSAIIYLFPLWVADVFTWGPKDVGYFFGLVGVVMITLQGGLLAALTKVFGHINVLRVGSVTFASLCLSLQPQNHAFDARDDTPSVLRFYGVLAAAKCHCL